MPDDVSTYLGVATGDNTESEITIEEDGFTVSPALEVNTLNVTYSYIALAGSDCTENGVLCVGAYTGNGASSQAIPTGFDPDLVWVKRTTAVVATFRTSEMSDNNAAFFSAAVNNTTGTYFTTLNNDGFTVGLTNNTNAGIFYFVALKNLAGKFTVGKFTGNGVDNRDITGLGYEPDAVFVKQDSANVAVFSTTEAYGDWSYMSTAVASAVNHIQDLQSDGFQVGNSVNVNANGVVSYWFAFGGSSDPVPAGSFLIHSGSYTGTGAAQTIETPFRPNLIIIKSTAGQYAVWSLSIQGYATEYFALAGAAFTGGITGVTDDGFSLGTNAITNANGSTYEYTVFGNATSPMAGAGAEDFYIGAYTGNGIDNRKIDHLGFEPSMVVVKRSQGTANQSFWKAADPVMADDTSAHFSATADNTAGAFIRSLDSDGFTIGSNAGGRIGCVSRFLDPFYFYGAAARCCGRRDRAADCYIKIQVGWSAGGSFGFNCPYFL